MGLVSASRWFVPALIALLWGAPAAAQMTEQAERQLKYCWEELATGDFDRARKSAESALRLDPGLYEAMICKAEVYEATGEVARARTVVGAYLELRVGLDPSERAVAAMERLGVQRDGSVVEPEPEPDPDAPLEDGDVPPPPVSVEDAPAEPEEPEEPALPEPQRGPWASWDPAVYRWGADRAAGSFALGGVGLGLFALGDQLTTAAAVNQGIVGRSPGLGAFITLNHIPLGAAEDTLGDDWAGAYVGEFFLNAGLIMTVPGLLGPVPHLVLATAGMDLRTVKAAAGIGGGVTLLSGGITALARVGWLYAIEWDNQQFTGKRFHFIVPGVVSLVAGVSGLTIGTIDLLFGVLYATGAIEAKEQENFLPQALRWGPPRVTPWMAADQHGGSAGVLVSWRAQ